MSIEGGFGKSCPRGCDSDPEWLDRDENWEEILSLLPPKVLNITMEQMIAMRLAFEDGVVPGVSWHRHGR
jgi:hypothetical protein